MANYSLSPLQLQALDLLLQGVTITETAQQLEISRYTIHHWARNIPAFIAVFQECRQRHQEDVMDRYHALAAPSVKLLQNLIEAENKPDSIRLRAALAVMKSIETGGPNVPFTLEQRQQLNQTFPPQTMVATAK
jgi:hypothetical protein